MPTLELPVEGTRVLVYRDLGYTSYHIEPQIRYELGTVVPCDGKCECSLDSKCFHVLMDRENDDFEQWNNQYILYSELMENYDMSEIMERFNVETVSFEELVRYEICPLAEAHINNGCCVYFRENYTSPTDREYPSGSWGTILNVYTDACSVWMSDGSMVFIHMEDEFCTEMQYTNINEYFHSLFRIY